MNTIWRFMSVVGRWPWQWVVPFLVLLFFAFGVAGFRLQEASWLDALYGAMQFFVFEDATQCKEDRHWILEVARFGAPLTLVGGLARAGYLLLRDQLAQRRLRSMSGHILICGAHENGGETHGIAKRLAEAYLARRRDQSVVCILPERNSPVAWELENLGAQVVKGSADDMETLSRAQAIEADRAIVAMKTEERSADVIRTLSNVLSARTRVGRLSCHVASPEGLVEREWDAGLIAHGDLTLHPFSIPRAAARRLLTLYPPWEHRLPGPGDRPLHVLVVGFGPQAKGIIQQVIRVCHFADEQNVRLTVVSRATADDEGTVWCRSNMPEWPKVADIQFISEAPLGVLPESWGGWQEERGAFDQVYISVEDDDSTSRSLEINEKLPSRMGLKEERAHQVVVYRVGSLSGSAQPDRTIFSLQDEAFTLEAMVNEAQDRLAQHIHNFYAGKYNDDRSWEVLTADLRDSNRDQADHLWAKLAIVGLADPHEIAEAHRLLSGSGEGVSTSGREGDRETPLTLLRHLAEDQVLMARFKESKAGYDEDLVERLAKVEHRRWMASRIVADWSYAPVRSDRDREHHLLVGWNEMYDWNSEDPEQQERLKTQSEEEVRAWLDEKRKEALDKDRDTARNLPDLLKLAVQAMSGE